MIANTSLNKNDILDLSIGEIESIIDGISRANGSETTKDSKQLNGSDAIVFLMKGNGTL